MNKRITTKLLRKGNYAAEVDIELMDSDVGWAPYLSLQDANKLDVVRIALQREDLQRAGSALQTHTIECVDEVDQ